VISLHSSVRNSTKSPRRVGTSIALSIGSANCGADEVEKQSASARSSSVQRSSRSGSDVIERTISRQSIHISFILDRDIVLCEKMKSVREAWSCVQIHGFLFYSGSVAVSLSICDRVFPRVRCFLEPALSYSIVHNRDLSSVCIRFIAGSFI
jgi:hypothetical protein